VSKNKNIVNISTPTNASLGWITPIFHMAITHQQLKVESCSNSLYMGKG